MHWLKWHQLNVSVDLTWSLPLKWYPAPVFHGLCCWNNSSAEKSSLASAFFFSLQVWSLEQPDWHCKIDEGSIGLLSSRWSPDGRHILNTTEFHVSVNPVCAWSLVFVCSGVCLCTSLSGFNCCWPVKKGEPENSQTPEPSLTTPAPHPPSHPPPPHKIHVFVLISSPPFC